MKSEIINAIYGDNKKLSKSIIEINGYCNFKCDHCYICSKKELSLKNFKKAVDELYDLECLSILITGGECLLNPNFKEMYLYAKKKGFLLNINTNGYLLNKDIVDFLSKNKPYSIEISLYGYDKKSYYEFTHVEDSFEKIDKNIDYALEKELNISLKTPITRKSIENFDKLREYSNKKGICYRYDYVIFPKLDSSNDCEERLNTDEILEFIKNDPDSVKYYIDKFNSNVKNSDNPYVFQCAAGEESIYIDCEGYINMCLVVSNKKFNIENFKIKDVQNEFKKFKKLRFSENSKCFRCNKKNICRYCPGRFFLETQDYSKPPEWYCGVTNKIINYIGSSYLIIDKKSCELTLNELENMYKILIDNLKVSIPNFKEDTYDKQTWIESIKNNNFNFILIYDKGSIIGFLEYYLKDEEVYISEIDISNDYKGDQKTFKTMIKKFYSLIPENIKIKCRINDNNTKSINVFTHIGMKKVGNKLYEMSYKELGEYIEK